MFLSCMGHTSDMGIVLVRVRIWHGGRCFLAALLMALVSGCNGAEARREPPPVDSVITKPKVSNAGSPPELAASYPDVWWWQVKGSLRDQNVSLYIQSQYQKTPQLASEVYLVIYSYKRPSLAKTVEVRGFFSGHSRPVLREISLDNGASRFHFHDGAFLDLHPVGIHIANATRQGERTPSSPAHDRVEHISAFGMLADKHSYPEGQTSKWLMPTVERSTALDQPLLDCDPFHWGVQAFDAQSRRLWQNVVVAYGQPVLRASGPSGRNLFQPYSNECWTPGQREIATVQEFTPVLRDGSLLLVLGNSGQGGLGVLRIRHQDGLPARVPSNVNILQYAGVLRFKAVLADAYLERSLLYSGPPLFKLQEQMARNNFQMLQSYFFPHLMADFYVDYKSNDRPITAIQGSQSK